jgi:transcriptional regulator with XRE-family HTH domain
MPPKPPPADDDAADELVEVPQQRLAILLQALEQQQGLSQGEIALRLKVPRQYLSDVKTGRRGLSELFARRFQEEFGVDHLWLLGQRGSMEIPRLDRGAATLDARRMLLPVFVHPIAGDPHSNSAWDGSVVEVAGVAAARVLLADHPYVLRFGADDLQHRLRRSDLLLISQAIKKDAEIQILKAGRKMFLARLNPAGSWEPLNPQNSLHGKPSVHGHCLGILWGAL